MDLYALLEEARLHPAQGLGRLAWKLRHDLPWRARCGLAATDSRAEELARALSGEPVALEPDDGLSLLAAIDRHLTDQEVGCAPLRVSAPNHDPPLWIVPRPRGWTPPLAAGGTSSSGGSDTTR